jgi:hypothetical protein
MFLGMLELSCDAEVVGADGLEGGGRITCDSSQSPSDRETRSTRCNANQPHLKFATATTPSPLYTYPQDDPHAYALVQRAAS